MHWKQKPTSEATAEAQAPTTDIKQRVRNLLGGDTPSKAMRKWWKHASPSMRKCLAMPLTHQGWDSTAHWLVFTPFWNALTTKKKHKVPAKTLYLRLDKKEMTLQQFYKEALS